VVVLHARPAACLFDFTLRLSDSFSDFAATRGYGRQLFRVYQEAKGATFYYYLSPFGLAVGEHCLRQE